MAKIYGTWEYEPGSEVTEEAVAQAARDVVTQPIPAGWHMSFLKASRGSHAGVYLRVWEIDSIEAYDRVVTAEGLTPMITQWFVDNPEWTAAHDTLSSLALEPS